MRMRMTLAGLTAAILATTSMTVASYVLVQSAEAAAQRNSRPTADQAMTAFFDKGYGWCDASVLSQYWQMDWSEAKVTAGEKILRGDQRYLDEALGEAYGRYQCSQAFNYEDSTTLAALWNGTAIS